MPASSPAEAATTCTDALVCSVEALTCSDAALDCSAMLAAWFMLSCIRAPEPAIWWMAAPISATR